MAYESTPIINETPSQAPVMVERVFEPYKDNSFRPTSPGQNDIKREALNVPTEDTVKLSPQMAALARREQKFRQQQQQFEKDKSALTAEKSELAQLRSMKEKLSAKDYSGLDGLVDYNEYSNFQVNKLNGRDPREEELKKLNDKVQDLEKRTQDNITQQFEAAVQERRLAASELIDKTSEFPKIKRAKAHEAVVQHIMDTWENDSKELSIEQAAKEVEQYFTDRANQWSKLLQEEQQESGIDQKKPLPPLRNNLRTLTNNVTSGQANATKPLSSYSNDSERYAEARRRAEAKLQQR